MEDALSSSVRLLGSHHVRLRTLFTVSECYFLDRQGLRSQKVAGWPGSRAAKMTLGVICGIGSHWFIPLHFLVQAIYQVRIEDQHSRRARERLRRKRAQQGSGGFPSPVCSSSTADLLVTLDFSVWGQTGSDLGFPLLQCAREEPPQGGPTPVLSVVVFPGFFPNHRRLGCVKS